MIKTAPDAWQEIRDAVRALCAEFPDEYHRKIDEQRAYPEAFVNALTQAGWLAAMIPTEYGGSGLGLAEASVIMEEINRSGGNSGRLPWSDVQHGHAAAARLESAKRAVPAQNRQWRVAPAIHGRDRAGHGHRHHQDQDHGREAR
jgi:Acyl-CoA dehydrogenases